MLFDETPSRCHPSRPFIACGVVTLCAIPLELDRSLAGHFAALQDQRCPINGRHTLIEMVVIAIAGVLGGADGWTEIAEFGRTQQTWFQGFLELPEGIPSHDIFGRVFALLQPQAFETCFRAWVASLREVIPGEIIAIDAMGCQTKIAEQMIDQGGDYVLVRASV